MKAVFEVKSIESQWQPPFKKTIETREFTVDENEQFEKFDGRNDFVFKLIRASGDNAVVEYHKEFTPKSYEQPQNKQVTIGFDEPLSFTYQWGADGITKTVTLKQITA